MAMEENLGITRGLISSEAVMMALGQSLGRSYAHDLIYDLCQRAAREKRSLAELLGENQEIMQKLSKQELEELCDPKKYLGLSVEMTTKVLYLAGC